MGRQWKEGERGKKWMSFLCFVSPRRLCLRLLKDNFHYMLSRLSLFDFMHNLLLVTGVVIVGLYQTLSTNLKLVPAHQNSHVHASGTHLNR